MDTYVLWTLFILAAASVVAAVVLKFRGMAASDNAQRMAQATQRLRYARNSATGLDGEAAPAVQSKRAPPNFGRR